MLTKELQEQIIKQINMEFVSAYLYLGLAAACESLNYRGSARWMRAQAEEEKGHAMRLFEFMVQRNAEVKLLDIPAPSVAPKTLLDVFKLALEHEQKVTASIDRLYGLAFEQRSFSTAHELSWFLKEQIEEEKSVRDIVRTIEMLGDDPAALLDLDGELGERKEEEEEGDEEE
ncbi:MAG: ferritin [Candidatus Sumerlaeaceae bacterium]|nr:ferritin [Candidatus Sumerlaeaceae bacterium]